MSLLRPGKGEGGPAAAFAGTTRSSPWDEFQVAYFTGEANWNYLVAPFLSARLPGKIEAQAEPRVAAQLPPGAEMVPVSWKLNVP